MAHFEHSPQLTCQEVHYIARADVRLQAHLHAPPATIIPAEDDDDLLDAPPDIDVPVSTAVSSALIHLEHAIDGMHCFSHTIL